MRPAASHSILGIELRMLCIQGLPEGHTEACYPLLRPGVDSHRAAPLKDSDADKREVLGRTPQISSHA